MKKYFYSILFLLIVSSIRIEAGNTSSGMQKANIRALVNLLIDDMDLIIVDEPTKNSDGTSILATKTPSSYDIEVVMKKIKNCFSKYSDIEIFGRWSKVENGEYAASYKVVNSILIINYTPETHLLVFGYNAFD